VVIKTVHAPLAADWIASRVAGRVVVSLRHPLNIVASWVEFGWGGCALDSHPKVLDRYVRPWGIRSLEMGCSDLARAAWEVALFIFALTLASKEHPDWIVVRHEVLCLDPATQFKALFDALGLQWTGQTETYLFEHDRPGSGHHTFRVGWDQPERWRHRLTADQVAEAMSVFKGFPFASLGLTDEQALGGIP
jgi:hypothetical protein